jgi:hypothetical protein
VAVGLALSLFRPRVERSLLQELKADRLLRWAFLGLWLAALIPMFFTPFLPMADMGVNVTMASLIWNAASGHGVASTYYTVSWLPNPYWTAYFVMALVDRVAGPLLAAKAITAIALLLVPLGIMRLLLTLGRNPRLALWAFLLGYDNNVFAGWLSLVVGFGYCFFIIAWTLEAKTVKDAARVAVHAALLGVTHIQGVWLLIVTVPLLIPLGRPLLQRFWVHSISLGGICITILPWLLVRTGPQLSSIRTAFGFEWHTPTHKLGNVFHYTLDTLATPEGVRITAAAFVILALGPLFLAVLPRHGTSARGWAPLALVLAAGALYMTLPFAVSGPISHWYTYPRYATVTLLFMLLVPSPRLDGRWALALVPGIWVNLWQDVRLAEQFAAFGQRTRPLLQIIDKVRPEAAILPLVLDDAEEDPGQRLATYHQLFTYVTAYRKGYEGYFWHHPKWPLSYREEKVKPQPGWGVTQQMAFTMDSYGKYYDYVLVQGFQNGDPVMPLQSGPLPRPKLVIEAGRWRLYEIER